MDTQVTTSTTITVPIADYNITVLRSGSILRNASVTVLYSDGTATGITASSGSNGIATITLSPGTYKFKIKKNKKTWGTGAFAFPASDPLTIEVN